MNKACPRCNKASFERNLFSLFFSVQICTGCAKDEAKGQRRTWHTHPEIAEYDQDKSNHTTFQSIRRHKFSKDAVNTMMLEKSREV